MSVTTLTVAELYEAIWSTPLSHLATRWQVNAHALGQFIDTLGLPRPASGYWTQQALNKHGKVRPMPETVSPERRIDLTPLQSTKREKAKMAPSPLSAPTKSRRSFPLLTGIKASMSKTAFKYEFLMVQPYDATNVARLDVSPAMQARGIGILHTLLFHCERQGWSVSVDKHRYAKRLTNVVVINGESVPFRLRERLRQVHRELDKEEREKKAKGEPIWHEKLNVPSGCLQFTVEGSLPSGSKGQFEDTPSLTLEEQLGHVLRLLACCAEHTKVVRAEREAATQRWEAQRLKQQAIEQRIRAEQKRIQTFTEFFAQWQRANDCRAFINALVGAGVYQDCTQAEQSRFTAWASEIADAIDPTVNGCASALVHRDIEERTIVDEAMRRYQQAIAKAAKRNDPIRGKSNGMITSARNG